MSDKLSEEGQPPDPSHATLFAGQSGQNDLLPGAVEWQGVRELLPHLLAMRRAKGSAPIVIDVREHWEYATVRLENALHLPLGEFLQGMHALDPRDEYVVLCHHGIRSLAAAQYLVRQGFKRVWNLSGGIDRYASDVDATLPRY